MRLRRCWRKRDETRRDEKALTRRMLEKSGRNRSRIANESSLTGEEETREKPRAAREHESAAALAVKISREFS